METVEAGEASVEVTEEEQIEAEIEAAQEVDLIAAGDAPAAAAAAEGDADAEVQVETVSEADTPLLNRRFRHLGTGQSRNPRPATCTRRR